MASDKMCVIMSNLIRDMIYLINCVCVEDADALLLLFCLFRLSFFCLLILLTHQNLRSLLLLPGNKCDRLETLPQMCRMVSILGRLLFGQSDLLCWGVFDQRPPNIGLYSSKLSIAR